MVTAVFSVVYSSIVWWTWVSCFSINKVMGGRRRECDYVLRINSWFLVMKFSSHHTMVYWWRLSFWYTLLIYDCLIVHLVVVSPVLQRRLLTLGLRDSWRYLKSLTSIIPCLLERVWEAADAVDGKILFHISSSTLAFWPTICSFSSHFCDFGWL